MKFIYEDWRWDTDYMRFKRAIIINGKTIHLGVFNNEEDAAKVYDGAAISHFGEYANLNLDKETENAETLKKSN